MGLLMVFDSDDWSAQSIHEYYKRSKLKEPFRTVFRISSDAVVKRVVDKSEFTVMELVRNTTIPTPRLLLRVQYNVYSYAVMEYIKGQTVAEAWSSMPSATKENVMETLRDYVLRLRAVKEDDHSSTPGPPGPFPMMCETCSFGDTARGPFKNYAEITGFLNAKVDLVNRDRPLEPLSEKSK